jgi:haloalkane dehalogenase
MKNVLEHGDYTGLSRRSLLLVGASLPTLALPLAGPALAGPQENSKPDGLAISGDFPFIKKRIEIDGSNMAYVDEGEGQPVLFLHGNPTSSYLWRNVIPYVTEGYRAIAPDLMGMGDSDKPDIGYTFKEQARYLDRFIEALNLKNIVLVIHDWGSALGMRFARINQGNVAAMVFMEAIVKPSFPAPGYEALGPQAGEMFKALRTDGVGEEMILERNFFVEEVLRKFGVMRQLTDVEMAAYRAPFPTP